MVLILAAAGCAAAESQLPEGYVARPPTPDPAQFEAWTHPDAAPHFVECTTTTLTIHRPGGELERIRRSDLSRSEAFGEWLRAIAADGGCVVFLVRDDGLRTFYVARSIARTRYCPSDKLAVAGHEPIDLDDARRRWGEFASANRRAAARAEAADDARAEGTEPEPIVVFCRAGRAYRFDEPGLQRVAEAAIDSADPAIERNDDGEIDARALIARFDERDFGDAAFGLKVEVHNFSPYLVCHARADAGVPIDRLAADPAALAALLDAADENGARPLRFRVWPDAFGSFPAVLSHATRSGRVATWEPQTRHGTWKIRLDPARKLRTIGASDHVQNHPPISCP